jgi:hypothetical protein
MTEHPTEPVPPAPPREWTHHFQKNIFSPLYQAWVAARREGIGPFHYEKEVPMPPELLAEIEADRARFEQMIAETQGRPA